MNPAALIFQRRPNAEEGAAKDRARRLWEQDRSRLLLTQPFLALLAMQLDLVPVVDSRLSTAATDGEHVFVDAAFLLGLSEPDRVFVLAHEIWHCALGHFARRGRREPRRWNLAVDHEVNALLAEQGLTVPDDAVLFPRQRGRNAEQVFEWLQRRAEERLPERGTLADEHEAPSTDAGESHAVIDPEFQLATTGRERVRRDWAVRVVAAAQQVERRHGELPGPVRRIVEAYRRPTVPWQQLLRQFLQQSHTAERSWTRPNRRFAAQGIYLPGRAGSHLDIAIAVDTSGSTTAWLPDFAAEINAIVGAFSSYRLRVITCDAAVHAVTEYTPDRPLRIEELALTGGGGTDFRPVFETLQADTPPEALVFLTDGFGDAPAQPPTWPVLWALPPHGEPPAPWGSVVRLE